MKERERFSLTSFLCLLTLKIVRQLLGACMLILCTVTRHILIFTEEPLKVELNIPHDIVELSCLSFLLFTSTQDLFL